MQTFCKAAFSLGFKDICKDNIDATVDFLEHVAEYGLNFGTQEEYMFRQEMFLAKDAEYKAINADKNNTFTVGHNFMSTWTHDEYKQLLGYKGQQTIEEPTILSTEGVPTAKDWRDLGAVNAVKNQARCGSCWAFSATSSMESAQFIQKGGKLLSLAEQQLVSCDKTCYGCNGGWQDKGMDYVKTNGQVTEAEYPYTSGHGVTGSCLSDKTQDPVVHVDSVNYVKPLSAAQLISAIATGPVSVTVEADTATFQGYTGGILNSSKCGTNLDHAITAVGYGEKDGQQYYIVRNSWGASWGDKGYIMIAAVEGTKGICGIQQQSVWPNMK